MPSHLENQELYERACVDCPIRLSKQGGAVLRKYRLSEFTELADIYNCEGPKSSLSEPNYKECPIEIALAIAKYFG